METSENNQTVGLDSDLNTNLNTDQQNINSDTMDDTNSIDDDTMDEDIFVLNMNEDAVDRDDDDRDDDMPELEDGDEDEDENMGNIMNSMTPRLFFSLLGVPIYSQNNQFSLHTPARLPNQLDSPNEPSPEPSNETITTNMSEISTGQTSLPISIPGSLHVNQIIQQPAEHISQAHYDFYQRLQEISAQIVENQLYNQALLESREEYDNQENVKNDSVKIKLKAVEYTSVKIKEKRKKTCSICLDNFKTRANVYYLPCEHLYHKECLDEWVKYSAQCPCCRQNIETGTN